MITQFVNGNSCYYDGEIHRYMDGTPISKEMRPCPKCRKMPTKEGRDACLGCIEGAIAACCGHGVQEGYVLWRNGKRQRLNELVVTDLLK